MKSCEGSRLVVFEGGDVVVSVLRLQYRKVSVKVREAVLRDRLAGFSYRRIGLRNGISGKAAWKICHVVSAQKDVSMESFCL